MTDDALRRWLQAQAIVEREKAADHSPRHIYHLGRQHAFEDVIRHLDLRSHEESDEK